MNKTIGILAHVDAGKTTFAEQILYHTNSIRNKGRVDHKNAFLDNHNIEKERGITIFSDQGMFNYEDSAYYLIDTPGHVDFSTEMERAMEVMDYAIVIISAVEGIQGHTETVWRLLRKNKIPTFIFINKIDRVGANICDVLEDIKSTLTKDAFLINEEFNNGTMSKDFIEFIAERDDMLFEKYMEDGYNKDLWINFMKKMIKENNFFPCFTGSALQDQGIRSFLESLHILTYTEYCEDEEFSGKVYKIRYDEQGKRVTYIKAISGKLTVRQELTFGENNESEKITQIRVYNGNKFKVVEEVAAGELFAVTGLSSLIAGNGVGNLKNSLIYDMVPTLKSKVIFDKNINAKDVLSYFKILESEDPALKITWDNKLQEIQVNIMGVIQLEFLKEVIKERFKVSIDFGPCKILYKETVLNKVVGYGHFEPLKHYAEVHLSVEPLERNSGIIFENKCHADDLTTGNQNLIGYHIYEKDHRGILTGSPITDLKITLLTGRAHNKHTCGGDFREATFRALRQGLEQAQSILLEPYYNFKIEVELECMVRVLSDIQKLSGSFDTPKTINNKVIIIGRGPVVTFMNYGMELVSFTRGKGSLSLAFGGYDLCHNEEEIIKNKNYDKNADIEYTSSSVFCSKGQGFIVKGIEAKEHMHCL